MSGISGVGGPPPEPIQPSQQSAQNQQKHEIELVISFLQSLIREADENNGNISEPQFSQLIHALATIQHDPHMPAKLQNWATSLIHLIEHSATQVHYQGGGAYHFGPGVLSKVLNQLREMEKEAP